MGAAGGQGQWDAQCTRNHSLFEHYDALPKGSAADCEPAASGAPCDREGLLCRHIEWRYGLASIRECAATPISLRTDRCCSGQWIEWSGPGPYELPPECGEPLTSSGISTCRKAPDSNRCFPIFCEDGAAVTVTVTGDPVGAGTGGTIVLGTYVLMDLTRQNDSTCPSASSAPVFQTVSLRHDGIGFFTDPTQARYFTYATSGSSISFTPACDPWPANDFGPYDTFTAAGDALTLFSSSCHARASYHRLPP
jgi:hypothetical protein